VVQQARSINAVLPIIARVHSEAEMEHLIKLGANLVVMGEHEIAKAMISDVGGVRSPTRPDPEPPKPELPAPPDTPPPGHKS
jgi:CPA2 family monovalent cation:H+ antiporter-2